MKQYILKASADTAEAAAQARKAIADGYRWIQTVIPADTDDDTARAIATAVADECRANSNDSARPDDTAAESSEFEIIMTLVDRPALVDELKITGLHLSTANPDIVRAAREQLGAHAIIGADCLTPDEALALKPLDIDYLTVPVSGDTATLDRFTGIVEAVNGNGHRHHIVARGSFTPEEEKILLGAGAAGFAVE